MKSIRKSVDTDFLLHKIVLSMITVEALMHSSLAGYSVTDLFSESWGAIDAPFRNSQDALVVYHTSSN